MAEVDALIGVFGAVDRAVVANPALTPAVASLLCPYRDGAAGWYPRFSSWVAEHGGAEARFPELEPALEALAGHTPRGRGLARRMLAVAALTPVLPIGGGSARDERRMDPELHMLAAQALTVDGLADSSDKGRRLLALLADTAVLPDLGSWTTMLQQALAEELISAGAAAQTLAPCAGQMIMIPGNAYSVAALETNFKVPVLQMTLAAAERFLDPSNWPSCSNLWCVMDPVVPPPAPNVHRYLEKISFFGCQSTPWMVTTVLDFMMFNLPTGNGAAVSYRLAPNQLAIGGDGLVTVDEGSIVVRQVGQDVWVHTTKRAQFTAGIGIDAGVLAMLACAVGYGAVGEDLVWNCAVGSAQGQGTVFPGTNVPNPSVPGQSGPAPGQPGAGQPCRPCQSEVGAVFADGVRAVQQCIADGMQACAGMHDKLTQGSVSSTDIGAEVTRMQGRVIRDVGLAAQLGARAANIVTTMGKPRRQGPPEPGPGPEAQQGEGR